jgi:ATP-binding cassette subfamily F protein 3
VLDSRNGGNGNGGGNAGAVRKAPSAATAQDRRREAAGRRQQTAPLRKKIRDIETLIESLQKEIHRLDVKLGDSGLYARHPAEAAELAKARADAVRSLAKVEADWIAASADLDAATAELE